MKFKWPWTKNELIAQLEAENAKMRKALEGKFELEWINYEATKVNGVVGARFRAPEFVMALAGMLDQWFLDIGAENYIEQTVAFDKTFAELAGMKLEVDIRSYTVIIQRRGAKTPTQHRDEARVEAERAKAEMFRLAEDYDKLKDAFDELATVASAVVEHATGLKKPIAEYEGIKSICEAIDEARIAFGQEAVAAREIDEFDLACVMSEQDEAPEKAPTVEELIEAYKELTPAGLKLHREAVLALSDQVERDQWLLARASLSDELEDDE